MDAPWSFGPASVAAFIVFIGILIFVHELGHFLVAKAFDIKVEKFSLGFGPALLSFRRGETVYQIAAVPLGGFVKMLGDNPADDIDPSDRARSFMAAPVHQRTLVALAGPAFNLLFPVLCFFAYNVLGPVVIAPVVGQIEQGKPADIAGLKTGDRILSVDGNRVWSFSRMRDLISERPGERLSIVVLRDGQEQTLEIIPQAEDSTDPFGGTKTVGRIHLDTRRQGTRVGVAFPAANAAGFVTGDRVLSVDSKPMRMAEDLEHAFAAARGRTVKVAVERPSPRVAGDLLHASMADPQTLMVPVPESFTGLHDLGLDRSETFLRRVVDGGAADAAGLKNGDQILAVAGRPIHLFWSFLLEMEQAKTASVAVVYRRDGVEHKTAFTNQSLVCQDEIKREGQTVFDPGIGLDYRGPETPCMEMMQRRQILGHWASRVAEDTEEARLTLTEAAGESVRQTVEVIGFVGLGLVKLLTNQISVQNVGGPIQLFKLAAQAAEVGIFAYLRMLALISVNLGLINLLPIPIFDGGHLVFCAVEAIKRKPISHRARELASLIGLVFIVALIVLAFRNDIMSLGIF